MNSNSVKSVVPMELFYLKPNQSLLGKSRTRFDELSVLKFLEFHFLQFQISLEE